MSESYIGNQSAEFEAIPTPSQLRKIALRALLFANRTDTLKRYGKKTHRLQSAVSTRRSGLTWVHSHYDPSNDDQGDNQFGKVSCLVARIPVFDENGMSEHWKMHYSHLSQRMGETGEWTGELRRYMFEWDEERTIAATINIKDVPSLTQNEIDRTWVLDLENKIPHDDFVAGQLLDSEYIANAEPTFAYTAPAEAMVYSEIMGTLDEYHNKLAA
jgi:hypothetical protein